MNRLKPAWKVIHIMGTQMWQRQFSREKRLSMLHGLISEARTTIMAGVLGLLVLTFMKIGLRWMQEG